MHWYLVNADVHALFIMHGGLTTSRNHHSVYNVDSEIVKKISFYRILIFYRISPPPVINDRELWCNFKIRRHD